MSTPVGSGVFLFNRLLLGSIDILGKRRLIYDTTLDPGNRRVVRAICFLDRSRRGLSFSGARSPRCQIILLYRGSSQKQLLVDPLRCVLSASLIATSAAYGPSCGGFWRRTTIKAIRRKKTDGWTMHPHFNFDLPSLLQSVTTHTDQGVILLN